ncbi:ABC transporter substrate-binding protein [Guggenheimella bovis]
MKKKLSLLLVVLMIVTGLVACTKAVPSGEPQSTETVTPQESTEPVSESAEPIKVTDSLGTEVTFEKPVEKVVSLAPNMTEILFAVGAGKQVVGRTDYCEYPKEAAEIPSIGSMLEPDVEKIITAKPDVVLLANPNEEVTKKLAEAGVKALVLQNATKVDKTFEIIETIANLTGHKEEGQKVTADMKAKIEEVANMVKDATPVTVYYPVSVGKDGDFAATGDTFIHDMLMIAGGDNIAKDAQGWSFNLESIIKGNPQVIIVGQGMGVKEKLQETDGYKDLTAVKEGKIFEIEADLLEIQGPRIAEGILELAKILHPDLVK